MTNEVDRRGTLRDTLRGKGLRATSARLAVLEVLLDAPSPLSHAEVDERLGSHGIDRATSYRNLIDLVEAGLARRTDLGDHIWRFESVEAQSRHGSDDPHAHFVCARCGIVRCLPADAVTLKPGRGVPRALVARAEVQVRGLCDDCG